MLPLNDRGNRYSLQGIRVELLTVQQHQPRRARPSDRSPSLELRGYREDPPPRDGRAPGQQLISLGSGVRNSLSSKLTRLAGEDAVLGGHLLVCGVELARNGFDHVPAGGGCGSTPLSPTDWTSLPSSSIRPGWAPDPSPTPPTTTTAPLSAPSADSRRCPATPTRCNR
jgi:hypothetical protein